ncbi:MAG: hypothetical protein KAR19_12670 [Bacteroidales bacterium]|nr:hypothetical protein [Bacteroidales bacterium]
MNTERASLHYYTWIEHAETIFIAASENLKLYRSVVQGREVDARERQLAFFRAAGLLFGISIELIIKARILYEKREAIESEEIKSHENISREWHHNGHNVLWLIKHYSIELNTDEKHLVEILQPFMIWAGRFPFPRKEHDILDYEQGEKQLSYPNSIDKYVLKFIERQKLIMSNKHT